MSELAQRHGLPDMVTWWLQGLAEFNAAGGRKPLNACLGIEPYSAKFPTWRAAKLERDKHLQAAYRVMKNSSIRSFLIRLESFKHNTWPNLEPYSQPPARLTAIEQELFFAFKVGRVPGSVGQLGEILSGKLGE